MNWVQNGELGAKWVIVRRFSALTSASAARQRAQNLLEARGGTTSHVDGRERCKTRRDQLGLGAAAFNVATQPAAAMLEAVNADNSAVTPRISHFIAHLLDFMVHMKAAATKLTSQPHQAGTPAPMAVKTLKRPSTARNRSQEGHP